jgi:hypothetical protein
MKTASMVLGIVGGAIALILALIFIIISVNFRGPDAPWLGEENIPDDEVRADSGLAGEIAFLVAGCIAFTAGALGLAGGLIAKRRHVAAGVLMLVAAALSPFSYYNVVSMILLVIGAIFALKRPHKATAPPRAQ